MSHIPVIKFVLSVSLCPIADSTAALDRRGASQTAVIKEFLPHQAFPLGLIELHRSLSSIRQLSTTLRLCV